MESNPKKATPWRGLGLALTLILFLGLVASRRWEQLVAPQVWCEDGILISDFAGRGWSSLLQPQNGYLVLLPRAVTGASLAISAYYYPLVSTLLAALCAALVGLAVARAPSHLRGRFLCAAALFVVPSDPEVFGLPLYTLWWAPVLLLIVALWDEGDRSILLRLASVAVGGLSSPFIVAVLPVLYFRALRYRRSRSERIVAFAATAVAAVQIFFIAGGANVALPPAASFLRYVVPRFCGWFLLGNFSENGALLWPLGLLIIAVIASFLVANRRRTFAWVLVYLYLAAVASSTFRADPAALHPLRGGPRYFFFPYILTFWILIQFGLTTQRPWLRRSIGLLCLVAGINALPVWSRRHDDLQWQEHLLSARLFPEYGIPIQSDGRRDRAWSIGQTGDAWDRLLRRGLLLPDDALASRPTFAYRVVGAGEPAAFSNGNHGSPPGGRSDISIANSGGRMVVTLRLAAGQRIRFRSGPVKDFQSMQIVGSEGVFIPRLPITTDWATLEFSNSRLPASFTLKIEDRGQGVGEWSEYDPWSNP